jgi:hypothetical protein
MVGSSPSSGVSSSRPKAPVATVSPAAKPRSGSAVKATPETLPTDTSEVAANKASVHSQQAETVPEISTAEGLWNHACEVASRRGSDEALFSELQFDSGDADRIRVRFRRPNTATAGFVQSNMDRVALILRESAGRRLAVELAAPAQPPDAAERASLDPAITENSLVREALELFDATIHSVRRLPPVSADDDSPENSSPGAQDDV